MFNQTASRTRGASMPTQRSRFRILTLEGLLTYDVFVLAEQQPLNLMPGHVLIFNENTYAPLTVSQQRLVPLGAEGYKVAGPHAPRIACHKCGKVEGVHDDGVHCPYHHGIQCGIVDVKA
jgi:hypothetical protein